jgi:hypothetical protein
MNAPIETALDYALDMLLRGDWDDPRQLPALAALMGEDLARHRDDVARAIHDGPNAQQQYANVGIGPHGWDECPYQDQYRADADAVLAYLTAEAS